ncbi:MAG TPA: phenylacetate--CoA ligase [Spirochaetota bacterium]|nr:phenylacetate--CoA ligase [Spirochaetota bacterium]HOM39078.1 phenylacetate--CoA ligase [Spirochaetota bacterium]HPQ49984.1 phenylacetate--CoA ligase [Spirochaetota bacterium]
MAWDDKIEFMSEKEIKELQTERLIKTVEKAYKSLFYKKKFDEVGLKPSDIKDLSDLKKIPFTTKDDLRAAYPFGMLTVDKNDIVRIHSSSGTTGKATVIAFTKKDIDTWADYVARCLYMIGMRKGDVFQNMMSYGLFTGGLGFHYGAEKLGATVIPIGGGNTAKQIRMILDFKTSFLHITPSYALHVSEEIIKDGIDPKALGLKGLIVGAEPHSEATRKKLEEIYNCPVFNSYGLSEMNGPGVGFECEYRDDPHIWEDGYIIEIVNPETGENMPDGEEGELVITSINREGMPILRYRTKDLTHIKKEKCKCGRNHKKIGRVVGRADDMLIVKGINVFPSQIEDILMSIQEVGNNYQIVVDRKEDYIDTIKIRVEISKKFFHGKLSELKNIKEKIQHSIREEIMINPEIELLEPQALPPSEGKAKRVVDLRKI